MEGSELSLFKIILDSGWIVKFVLFSLVLASVVSWAIVFLKRKMFKEFKKNNQEFWDIYQKSKSLRKMVEICQTLPFSPYKAIFVEGYEEFQKIKHSCGGDSQEDELRAHFASHGMTAIERALKKGFNQVNAKMDEYLSLLASIGSLTPFVGLFGTVWGIIDSFTGLASGGATLDAVAPGIAEALVATAVGLAAAIPAVWFYNHYNNVSGKLNLDMNSFEQEFLNIVERNFA